MAKGLIGCCRVGFVVYLGPRAFGAHVDIELHGVDGLPVADDAVEGD